MQRVVYSVDAMMDYQELIERIRPIMHQLSNWVGYSLTQAGGHWDLTIYIPPGFVGFLSGFDALGLLPVRIHRVPMSRFSAGPSPAAPLAHVAAAGSPVGRMGSPVSVRGAQGEIPGSIGTFVRNADGVWLLSANHVLACNGRHLPLADPSHGVYLGTKRVSRTIVFSELKPHGYQADAAACLLDPAAGIVPAWPPGWTPNPNPFTPTANLRVKVSVNGVDAFGTVTGVGTFHVAMGSSNFPCSLDDVEFNGSILVQADDAQFALPGNSGGLIVTADAAGHPIGLITGTNVAHFVVVSPLAKALADLGLPGQIMV